MMKVVRPCMSFSNAVMTSPSEIGSSAEVTSSRKRSFGSKEMRSISKNENKCTFEENAGNAHTLLLSTRKSRSSLTKLEVETLVIN